MAKKTAAKPAAKPATKTEGSEAAKTEGSGTEETTKTEGPEAGAKGSKAKKAGPPVAVLPSGSGATKQTRGPAPIARGQALPGKPEQSEEDTLRGPTARAQWGFGNPSPAELLAEQRKITESQRK